MKSMKIISVVDLVGSTELAGTDMGVSHLPKLLEASLSAAKDELLLLDFSGANATASYLSQSVVKLLRMANAGELDRFFVFVGLNKHTKDDLEIVLRLQKMPALTVDFLSDLKNPRGPLVIGHLEPLYRELLDRVSAVSGTSAEELMEGAQDESIQKTAWLNRLAYLASQRLIRREKRARELFFKPVYMED